MATSHSQAEREEHERFGRTKNLVLHETVEKKRTTRLRDLIHPPTIRQWIAGGKLYREASPREAPRIELFLDLLYVGVIHQLADAAIEEPNGLSVARFILTFWPSWSVWEEARRYSNVSGTDDFVHRFWVLVGMICILGYTANATAIPLHMGEIVGEAATEAAGTGAEGTGTGAEGEAHVARALRLLLRATTTGEGEAHYGDSTPVHAAAAFYLIIKLTRVLVLFLYAWALPDFRTAQFLSGIATMIPMFAYLPLIWVTSRRAQIALAVTGICLDLARIDMILFNVYGRYRAFKRKQEIKRQIAAGEIDVANAPDTHMHFFRMVQLPEKLRLPAINIEHAVDRSGAFTVLVLGELVANLLYIATPGEYGAGHKFGKAALGFMVAWAINYMYTLPSDKHMIRYEHALRRSWLTGILFNFFHWPLCASLVLAAAAAHNMVKMEYIDNDPNLTGVKWFWGCGLGFALFFLALIDMLHGEMDPWNVARIPRVVRFAFACFGALALCLFPLSADHLTSTEMMGIAVGITWTVLAVYIFGALPRPSKLSAADMLSEAEAQEPIVTVTDLRRADSVTSRTSLRRNKHVHGPDDDYHTEHYHDDHAPESHDPEPEQRERAEGEGEREREREREHEGDGDGEGRREATWGDGLTVAAMT